MRCSLESKRRSLEEISIYKISRFFGYFSCGKFGIEAAGKISVDGGGKMRYTQRKVNIKG